MDNTTLNLKFSKLSTPVLCDACLRLKLRPRLAPSGISPLIPETSLAGKIIPVKHYGSVDIFLEAAAAAKPGDIMVIDNQGRKDEGCIGDLTALEAKARKMAGIIVWGCHRDTRDLKKIKFPVFSCGKYPSGPVRLDKRPHNALEKANFGENEITSDDIVFADEDGVLFVNSDKVEEVIAEAEKISLAEQKHAELIKSGCTLFEQFDFKNYLTKKENDPDFSFRKHLKTIGAAIEE